MNKHKSEGISVQELENLGKKHMFEIFFSACFLLSTLCSFLFFGAGWSVFLSGVGGILGIVSHKKMENAVKNVSQFFLGQEKNIRLIFAAIGIILSVFLPPVTFLFLGFFGGTYVWKFASRPEVATLNEAKESKKRTPASNESDK